MIQQHILLITGDKTLGKNNILSSPDRQYTLVRVYNELQIVTFITVSCPNSYIQQHIIISYTNGTNILTENPTDGISCVS